MANSNGCGSGTGSCGCASAAQGSDAVKPPVRGIARSAAESLSVAPPVTTAPIATVNGVALHVAGDRPDDESLRQRAHAEILRQEAVRCGLLSSADVATDDGVQSEAASTAIEQLLERELDVPQPDASACLRYFEGHRTRFQNGERVQVRHILFAVTPGVDVTLLRGRAETALLDARCHDDNASDRFESLARELSNCPSGADGGALGWLTASECAPEFARELFGQADVGVLPRLVHSRFGLHVVEVLARQPGVALSFAAVRGAVAQALQQQSYIAAMRQYLQLLAADAHIEGVELDRAESALVQ